MAYMNQDKKAVIKSAIDAAIANSGRKVKYSLTCDHSSIKLAIMSADIDLITNYNECARAVANRRDEHFYEVTDGHVQVNNYHIDTWFSGEARELLLALNAALNTGNYNNSDLQSDTFDVGFYSHLHLGKWNRPFVAVERDVAAEAAKKKAAIAKVEAMMREHGISVTDLV